MRWVCFVVFVFVLLGFVLVLVLLLLVACCFGVFGVGALGDGLLHHVCETKAMVSPNPGGPWGLNLRKCFGPPCGGARSFDNGRPWPSVGWVWGLCVGPCRASWWLGGLGFVGCLSAGIVSPRAAGLWA